ncbi:SlyX family protein [uncultured Luteimonas sp.]|uniref:SlyX family protein n=1 Tax=uncultured Luteimonas sp. TaxID=453144 RepID=UPI00260C4545|nr:SlyX family protein [uncultured Luteimonas sp.]
MSDALEQRVVELETRMAFQEQLISELNDALTQMRLEAVSSAELLKRVLEDLKLTRGDGPGDAALEPPPPHY